MRKFKMSLDEYARTNNQPKLLDEYADTNTNSPSEIGCNSTVTVTWICAHGHTETESVQKRIRRGYCSVCGPKSSGSFAQLHPDMLKYWSKKNTVSPYEIPPNYSQPVLWECPEGHSWERKITIQLSVKSCPLCKSSLFVQLPDLLDEWDAEANKGIDPNSVYAYSNTAYMWKCKNGHSYSATPAQLMRRSYRCPVCESFGYLFPDAAAEWNYDKNEAKTPFDFTANSQKNAWFICAECGSEYTSKIANRARRKSSKCPCCSK